MKNLPAVLLAFTFVLACSVIVQIEFGVRLYFSKGNLNKVTQSIESSEKLHEKYFRLHKSYFNVYGESGLYSYLFQELSNKESNAGQCYCLRAARQFYALQRDKNTRDIFWAPSLTRYLEKNYSTKDCFDFVYSSIINDPHIGQRFLNSKDKTLEELSYNEGIELFIFISAPTYFLKHPERLKEFGVLVSDKLKKHQSYD